jgi:hypothetical protein
MSLIRPSHHRLQVRGVFLITKAFLWHTPGIAPMFVAAEMPDNKITFMYSKPFGDNEDLRREGHASRMGVEDLGRLE